ncbi:AAA family ATPase [Xanthomonas sacchari]
MKLIRLELIGTYKGLKDQTFDFSSSRDDVSVLIGPNGSGKSQVMELIAEIFSYLERHQRPEFKVRDSLGFTFCVTYELTSPQIEAPIRYVIDTRKGLKIRILREFRAPSPTEVDKVKWETVSEAVNLNEVRLPRVVGYASGLSENLQRPFLKNSVQFHDVIRVRSRHQDELNLAVSASRSTDAIEKKYLKRHPGIFTLNEEAISADIFTLDDRDTPAPRSIFLDYDCASLLIMIIGMLEKNLLKEIWSEVPFCHPQRAILHYDLRGHSAAKDAASDIQRLLEIAGSEKLTPRSSRSSEVQYERYQLDYLAADIEIDYTDPLFQQRLQENHRDPAAWFLSLYKLQLLGVAEWPSDMKKKLRHDSFQGHVKKPLKGKLPLSVRELWMTNGQDAVSIDDLSDGELQLLLTLGAVLLLGDAETLFLFDEPETHLNPSWRTRFHLDFRRANLESGFSQALISSHSPFLVSSLPRESVFHFHRSDGATTMDLPASETFGASFDVLIKKHFDLKAAISDTALSEIRSKLDSSQMNTHQKIAWLKESLGDSMERSYLIKRLGAE